MSVVCLFFSVQFLHYSLFSVYLFLVCASGWKMGKKQNIFAPGQFIANSGRLLFGLAPGKWYLKKKKKLKVYHHLAVLASDKKWPVGEADLGWQTRRDENSMLHTFTLAVSKEWAPHWQRLLMPISVHSSTAQGLVTAETSRESFTRKLSFCVNKQCTNIHVWINTVYCTWFVLIVSLTNVDNVYSMLTHLKALKAKYVNQMYTSLTISTTINYSTMNMWIIL